MEETQLKKKYFIGIPVRPKSCPIGIGSEYVDELRRELATRFDLPDPTVRIPPHCTLVSSFMADERQITRIAAALRDLALLIRPFTTLLHGFGGLESHTHHLPVDIDAVARLKLMRSCLRGVVQEAGCKLRPNLGDTFHVSVATDIPDAETHAAIGKFLHRRTPQPAVPLDVDRITLYERRGIRAPRWVENICYVSPLPAR